MRNALILTSVIALAAMLAAVGCKKESTVKPGGGTELTLVKPGDLTIQRGATVEVKVKIERKNLTGDISVDFDGLPKGVTVVDAGTKIVGNEGTYVLKASDTAEMVAKHQAKVTVKDPKGVGVSQMFGITVKGNDPGGMLTLAKLGDVTIQRGGTAQVKVAIERKNLTGEVSFDFDNLPKGVTVTDKDKKLAGNEAAYTLNASDSAELVAKHQVKVTAKAPDGPGVSQMFSITVEEKK